MKHLNNSNWTLAYVVVVSLLTLIFYNTIWVPIIKPQYANKFNINILELLILFLYVLMIVANVSFEKLNDLGLKAKLRNIALVMVVIWSPFALIAGWDMIMAFAFPGR
jgi:hypothetical protein